MTAVRRRIVPYFLLGPGTIWLALFFVVPLVGLLLGFVLGVSLAELGRVVRLSTLMNAAALATVAGVLSACRPYDMRGPLTDQDGLLPAETFARYGTEQTELMAIGRAFAQWDGGADAALVPEIRRIVKNADPEQPISDIQPLSTILEGQTTSRAVQVRVLGAFAAVSCLLAAVGLHGLLAFVVAGGLGLALERLLLSRMVDRPLGAGAVELVPHRHDGVAQPLALRGAGGQIAVGGRAPHPLRHGAEDLEARREGQAELMERRPEALEQQRAPPRVAAQQAHAAVAVRAAQDRVVAKRAGDNQVLYRLGCRRQRRAAFVAQIALGSIADAAHQIAIDAVVRRHTGKRSIRHRHRNRVGGKGDPGNDVVT